ncbi:hypothetical protein LSM04_002897 [Trypanosoma melophagium]|uniref:uncharacterized protein n=1 Tax=Trypanosoma melophagium TaxID=715481 RepID=UPI00351A5AEF|nr:hypothetical protein LSM04_002897 [Trypanosoma melophagium]
MPASQKADGHWFRWQEGVPRYFLGKRRKRGVPPSTSMTPPSKRISRPECRKRTGTTTARFRKEKAAPKEQAPPED